MIISSVMDGTNTNPVSFLSEEALSRAVLHRLTAGSHLAGFWFSLFKKQWQQLSYKMVQGSHLKEWVIFVNGQEAEKMNIGRMTDLLTGLQDTGCSIKHRAIMLAGHPL